MTARAEVFLAQDEALKAAFPDADQVERKTYVLSERERQEAERRARAGVESRLFTFYEGRRQGVSLGYAAIDAHTVRTQQEAFMVVLDPQGRIRKTLILAFHEPAEYLAAPRWLAQFEAKSDPDQLAVGNGVAGIVGSTLTSHAIAGGVRKVLALFQLLIIERQQ